MEKEQEKKRTEGAGSAQNWEWLTSCEHGLRWQQFSRLQNRQIFESSSSVQVVRQFSRLSKAAFLVSSSVPM